MDLDLQGKVAIVTGAAKGIGKSIALALAREGANIIVADVLRKAAESVAEECREFGVEAIALEVDVSNPDKVYTMASIVVDRFGKIDILVNNAGTSNAFGWIWETEKSHWSNDIETCLYGTLNCSRAIAPHMMDQRSGRIVNISSGVGRVGGRRVMGYVAAKAGILGVSKALALELAPYGIAVNVVAPGFIKTDQTEAFLEAEKEREARLHPEAAKERNRMNAGLWPLGRYGNPEDIANIVTFLSSAKATRYITGQTIGVDGGNTML
ncbi:SDR family NAD(P)-dependent oxidoreductase [Chloroflexota bacterium]